MRMRIDATNFALANDDGSVVRDYERADVILVGVSRSGKTPTCLYLAMQYGIFAANYPLTEEDLESRQLPRALERLRAQAVRPHHQARPAAADPQRAAAGQPLFLGAAGRVRGAGGRIAVRAPRHSRASTRRSARSRRSPAEFSTAPASNARCGPDNADWSAWYSRTMIADQWCETSWRARPGSFVSLMTLYESNFVRLGWLVRDLRSISARLASRASTTDCDLYLTPLELSPLHQRVPPDLRIRRSRWRACGIRISKSACITMPGWRRCAAFAAFERHPQLARLQSGTQA